MVDLFLNETFCAWIQAGPLFRLHSLEFPTRRWYYCAVFSSTLFHTPHIGAEQRGVTAMNFATNCAWIKASYCSNSLLPHLIYPHISSDSFYVTILKLPSQMPPNNSSVSTGIHNTYVQCQVTGTRTATYISDCAGWSVVLQNHLLALVREIICVWIRSTCPAGFCRACLNPIASYPFITGVVN